MKARNTKSHASFVSLALLLTLILSLAVPVTAFAAPTEERVEESVNITMEYRYAEGESVNIPDQITQAGRTYNLVSRADPVLESTLPSTRTYTYKIDGAISKKDLEEIKNIPNLVLTPVEVEQEREVDKKDVIKGLPNNDVEYLAESKEFKVSSAKSKDAVQKKELARAGVSYKVEAENAAGFPTKYTATIVYRGTETYSEVGYYTAKVNYQTEEVVGNIPQYVVVAVYAPDEVIGGSDTEVIEEPGDDPVIEEPPIPDEPDPDANVTELTDRVAEQFDNQTGNPFTDIINGNVPRGGFLMKGAWSIASMIIVFVAFVWSALLVFGRFRSNIKIRKYTDISTNIKRVSSMFSTIAVTAGLCAAIIWYLLDDLSLPMVMINNHTAIIFAFFVAQIVFTMLSNTVRRNEHKGDKEEMQAAG